MRPAAVFAASACAAGVVATYLPLALRRQGGWIAPAALLLHSAAATITRWIAGRIGDRRGQTGLLTPGLILSIVGMAALAVTASPWAVLAGAATFGSGFGILQNATLALMYSRVHQTRYSTVSAIWNAAYDLSMAVGAIGAGLLASGVGFTTAFLLTASAMLPALAVAHREATPQR